MIEPPYLLFLGDAPDPLAAKVAYGIRDWRPEAAVGQFRMEGCQADLGLPDMTLAKAREKGARSLVIGVANRGGTIAPDWVAILREALGLGFDLAAGLHVRLADVPELREAAAAAGRTIHDVRLPRRDYPIATGANRSGRRCLAVGTDCSVGKMYAMLAMEREMRERGMKADFRATGQTGIFIAGRGIPLDAVVADFISGGVEWLSPDRHDGGWDLIEGQGSLFHPSFAGVSLGLLHGAQPDALVLCHEPGRPHLRGLPHYPVPGLRETLEANLAAARLTNPGVVAVGVSLNTSKFDDAEAGRICREVEAELGLPAQDPVRHGVARIVDRLLETFPC